MFDPDRDDLAPVGIESVVLPPEEALKRARPLPSDDEMAIEGLTDDEWKAFEQGSR